MKPILSKRRIWMNYNIEMPAGFEICFSSFYKIMNFSEIEDTIYWIMFIFSISLSFTLSDFYKKFRLCLSVTLDTPAASAILL